MSFVPDGSDVEKEETVRHLELHLLGLAGASRGGEGLTMGLGYELAEPRAHRLEHRSAGVVGEVDRVVFRHTDHRVFELARKPRECSLLR